MSDTEKPSWEWQQEIQETVLLYQSQIDALKQQLAKARQALVEVRTDMDQLKEQVIEVVRTERQEAWGEAAKVAETFSKGYEVDWLMRSTKGTVARQVCIDLAELIREQAQKGQP